MSEQGKSFLGKATVVAVGILVAAAVFVGLKMKPDVPVGNIHPSIYYYHLYLSVGHLENVVARNCSSSINEIERHMAQVKSYQSKAPQQLKEHVDRAITLVGQGNGADPKSALALRKAIFESGASMQVNHDASWDKEITSCN